MASILKHKKCGGELFIDLSNMFTFKTPSAAISPDGIKVGVVEFQTKARGSLRLSCSKCDSELNPAESEEILVMCALCKSYHPVDEVYTSYQINALCGNCRDMISGKKEPSPSMQDVVRLLHLDWKNFKMDSFENILKSKPII